MRCPRIERMLAARFVGARIGGASSSLGELRGRKVAPARLLIVSQERTDLIDGWCLGHR